MRAYIDANVFVFAALNSEEGGSRARGILRDVVEGKVEGFTSSLTFDELMWVLVKNRKAHLMERIITDVYEMQNCSVLPVDSSIPLDALQIIKEYGLKPRDAFHLAVMRQNDLRLIFSDDRDFDAVHGIKRSF